MLSIAFDPYNHWSTNYSIHSTITCTIIYTVSLVEKQPFISEWHFHVFQNSRIMSKFRSFNENEEILYNILLLHAMKIILATNSSLSIDMLIITFFDCKFFLHYIYNIKQKKGMIYNLKKNAISLTQVLMKISILFTSMYFLPFSI